MSVVLRSPDALPRPPAAQAVGVVRSVGAPALTPTATTIRCGRCGGSRPVGHAHCYACGAKLTGRAERGRRLSRPSWSALRAWRGWSALRRALPLGRPATVSGQPVMEQRTFGDRAARWYVGLTAAGALAWFVWGGTAATTVGASAGIATPSEACAWIDAQRVQLTGEAARLVDAQRGGIAQRLGELAAVVGAGSAAR